MINETIKELKEAIAKGATRLEDIDKLNDISKYIEDLEKKLEKLPAAILDESEEAMKILESPEGIAAADVLVNIGEINIYKTCDEKIENKK